MQPAPCVLWQPPHLVLHVDNNGVREKGRHTWPSVDEGAGIFVAAGTLDGARLGRGRRTVGGLVVCRSGRGAIGSGRGGVSRRGSGGRAAWLWACDSGDASCT